MPKRGQPYREWSSQAKERHKQRRRDWIERNRERWRAVNRENEKQVRATRRIQQAEDVMCALNQQTSREAQLALLMECVYFRLPDDFEERYLQ